MAWVTDGIGEPHRVFKKATFSPAHPRRAETRLFHGVGRSEQEGEEVHTKLRLNRSLRSCASGEVLCLLALPYGEPLSDARTTLADFFNTLLARGEADS